MLVLIHGETTVPRAYRLLTLLLIVTFGLAVIQPTLARATTLTLGASAETVSQGETAGRTQPGAIVRQAFDLLMDRFVIPPKSGNLLNGSLDAAHFFMEKRQ